ncbi:C39 family peptidase [bacterium]|nr:C39 family peptidase [bacterium]MBU1958565.1 C39 family peptidase [bacterium]
MKKILLITLPLWVMADIHIVHKEYHIKKPIKSWIEFKNENLVRQKFDYSCGSASLATVMHYFYDQNMTEMSILNDILDMKGIGKEKAKELEEEDMSLSFLDLSQYIKTKGFKAIGLALDLKALKSLKAPVILFVKIRKNEHFTVFKGMDEKYVYLADPSFGNSKIKISKFKEMFYQRDDLKHPGKLLAILPVTKKTTMNKKFMEIQKSSNFIYDVIKTNTLKE